MMTRDKRLDYAAFHSDENVGVLPVEVALSEVVIVCYCWLREYKGYWNKAEAAWCCVMRSLTSQRATNCSQIMEATSQLAPLLNKL